jgi:hypothetical protein
MAARASIAVTMWLALASSSFADERPARDAQTTISRALDFLSAEVPNWKRENKCFSCHNNGDAARALYTAVVLGRKLNPDVLADTTDWLERPQDWKYNGGDGVFSDKTLATLQFAATLASAVEAKAARRDALASAAALVADLQQPDGSWKIDGADTIGSPATWGRALCTAMARQTLLAAGERRFQPQLVKSRAWLRSAEPNTVLDAAAVLLGVADDRDPAAGDVRARSLKLIREGESKTGGWGPYVTSSAEPFDTAVVIFALTEQPAKDDFAPLIGRGRAFLISAQLEDGSWPETTRPANAVSYAQRLSTAGWCLRALLLTKRN